jgi:hypothetical protein
VYTGQAKPAVDLIKVFPQCTHDPGACRAVLTARTQEAIGEWRAAGEIARQLRGFFAHYRAGLSKYGEAEQRKCCTTTP